MSPQSKIDRKMQTCSKITIRFLTIGVQKGQCLEFFKVVFSVVQELLCIFYICTSSTIECKGNSRESERPFVLKIFT